MKLEDVARIGHFALRLVPTDGLSNLCPQECPFFSGEKGCAVGLESQHEEPGPKCPAYKKPAPPDSDPKGPLAEYDDLRRRLLKLENEVSQLRGMVPQDYINHKP